MIVASAPVEVFDEIDSTILEARRRAERGETGPLWLIAKRQTAGRGRRGRVWASLEGNLLATYLFAAREPPTQIGVLTDVAYTAPRTSNTPLVSSYQAASMWPSPLMAATGCSCLN